ncbi:MAG: hypothetical protein PVG39_11375 [Desulfobacteraceae bacterium]|jgi:hypothetical protein
MGGSSSSSSKDVTETITNTTTSVETNTSTDIGEIGLTGQDAVAITDILASAGVMIDEINADTIKSIVQESGQGVQQLVGGANKLILSSEGFSQESFEAGGNIIDKAINAGGALVQSAQTFGQSLVKAGEGIANPAGQALETANEQTRAIRNVALLGIAVVGGYFLFRKRG